MIGVFETKKPSHRPRFCTHKTPGVHSLTGRRQRAQQQWFQWAAATKATPYVRDGVTLEHLEPRLLLACQPVSYASDEMAEVSIVEQHRPGSIAAQECGLSDGRSSNLETEVEPYFLEAVIDALFADEAIEHQPLAGQDNSAYRQFVATANTPLPGPVASIPTTLNSPNLAVHLQHPATQPFAARPPPTTPSFTTN